MISCQLEPLPQSVDVGLREWLGKPHLATLRRVVDAKLKVFASKSINEALTAKDFERKLDAANASLLMAQRYQTFLDVLQEVTDQKETFQSAKLT